MDTGMVGGKNWEHVHQCPRCQHVVRAEEIPHVSIATGVIICVKCDFSGPINLAIVPDNSHLSDKPSNK
jgi:hypothetical protein